MSYSMYNRLYIVYIVLYSVHMFVNVVNIYVPIGVPNGGIVYNLLYNVGYIRVPTCGIVHSMCIYASQLGVPNWCIYTRPKLECPIRVPNELFIKVKFWGCILASQIVGIVQGIVQCIVQYVHIRVPT